MTLAMTLATRLLLVTGLAATLALTGCGNNTTPPANNNSGNQHTEGDGHDHGEEGHAEEGHDEHGEERALGTLAFGDTVLAIALAGAVEAGHEAHVEVEVQSGPAPAAVRLWIGIESAEGSTKSLAEAHDGHFHGHVDAPATLAPEARLWVEVENAAGERSAQSIAFN